MRTGFPPPHPRYFGDWVGCKYFFKVGRFPSFLCYNFPQQPPLLCALRMGGFSFFVNFEILLEFAEINRRDIFVTNAVLCNPKNEQGNNATPSANEIENCADFLRRQIELVNPSIIATLGAVALKSLGLIEEHGLTLKAAVRTATQWNGRVLIPMYHPGPRAMIHRSFANQRSDYQFLAERLRKGEKYPRKIMGKVGPKSAELVKAMLCIRNGLSYFAVHKIAYLVEWAYFQETGTRLTDAYFIRQKDGPYCTDLHIRRISNSIPVRVGKRGGGGIDFVSGSQFSFGIPIVEIRIVFQRCGDGGA